MWPDGRDSVETEPHDDRWLALAEVPSLLLTVDTSPHVAQEKTAWLVDCSRSWCWSRASCRLRALSSNRNKKRALVSQENPYDRPATETALNASTTPDVDPRAEVETAVSVIATMLLAGAWAGARYQPRWFVVASVLATAGSVLGMLVYGFTSKRWHSVRFLPLLIIAVFGRDALAGLFFIVAFLGVPIGALYSIVRPTRQNWLIVGHLVLAGLSAVMSIVVYAQLQKLGARRAAERGGAIIRAIHDYAAVEGALPASLADLVPRELDAIPETGMVGYPHFEYRDVRSSAEDSGPLFATYELRVNLSQLLQFDCLVYWPEGNYPDTLYGGWVERIDSWAFVHE